jgi:hypothetical protein
VVSGELPPQCTLRDVVHIMMLYDSRETGLQRAWRVAIAARQHKVVSQR